MNSGKGAASSKTETEDEGIDGTGVAFFYGAVAGAALMAWGIGSALFSSPEPDPASLILGLRSCAIHSEKVTQVEVFSPNNWVLYSLSLSMDMIYEVDEVAWPGVLLFCSS
ncbi:hypothetical protein D5086_016354 [Populus alba]|uniref:Uncharacterized protein n=1 Tax=Populus alba TaxID=43335 RepID=A0ACC4BV69_POPAL